MNIERLLSPDCALAAVPGDSKKRILELIARTLSRVHPVLDEEETFDRLIERERLGSTGVGEGVAIPHCRLPNCCDTVGVLLQLDRAINFDAIDNKPVDLIFALVVPEEAAEAHLEALQAVAENFSKPEFRDRLRAATDNKALFEIAISASSA